MDGLMVEHGWMGERVDRQKYGRRRANPQSVTVLTISYNIILTIRYYNVMLTIRRNVFVFYWHLLTSYQVSVGKLQMFLFIQHL